METENLPTPLTDDRYETLVNVVAEDTVQPTERDMQIIEEMAAIGCTPKEICGVLKLSPDIFKLMPQTKDAVQRGNERQRVSLRRLQWKTAQKNPIMQIFLGKQILGQSDKVEHKDENAELTDARKGFADKFKNVIDITPKRKAPRKPKRLSNRKGSEVRVGETVGEGSAITTTG
jgi:hypothetical protein